MTTHTPASVNAHAHHYREISETEWERIPAPKASRPPNPWDEVVALLEAGKIVELEVSEEKLRGTRIGIARLAASRGFRVEFRPHDGHLAMRRSDKAPAARSKRAAKAKTQTQT